jgi:hypothetical protein
MIDTFLPPRLCLGFFFLFQSVVPRVLGPLLFSYGNFPCHRLFSLCSSRPCIMSLVLSHSLLRFVLHARVT